MARKKTQTFNDGNVSIYSIENISLPGNKPKEGLVIKHTGLRYDERTVGMSRFWTAKQEHVQIDIILRVPKHIDVSTQDIAIPIDGNQYKIVQIQYPPDVEPPCMDLSLERLVTKYGIN